MENFQWLTSELIYLFSGWLLGVLSVYIQEKSRRSQQQKDLISSIVNELEELQYIMGFVAYQIRQKRNDLSDEFLDWFIPIVVSYRGPEKDSDLADSLIGIRKATEEERSLVFDVNQYENKRLTVKKYSLPFLDAQASELSICPLDFQRRVFRVKSQTDIFNQDVSSINEEYKKTFDPSIVEDNRDAVMENITVFYKMLGRRAEGIATAIGEIISLYGKK